jgi:ferredoxin
MRVAAPFHTDLTEALRGIEADCVNACPTGALAWRIEELDDIRACDETQTGYS